MDIKFDVSEKQVKEVYGKGFTKRLEGWKEEVDWIWVKDKRCLDGRKRVYREDILTSLEKKLEIDQDEVKVDVAPMKMIKLEELPKEDEHIFEDVVANIFPNTRYVRTISGKTIFVGGKGILLKRGQRIRCKGLNLFLGKPQS